MAHPLQLILLVALMVLFAKLAGAAASRLGQPAVFGEILAGLLLGPTVFDILGWPLFQPAPDAFHGGASASLLDVVRDLAEVGVILLMFIAGMETDLDEMRQVGAVATWAALGGVLLPFGGGAAIAATFGLPLFWEGIFLGTVLTATSVSITAQTLMELGALRSKEGSTILGAAVIDDVMGIVLLSVVVALAGSGQATAATDVGMIALKIVGYFVLAIWLGRSFLRRLCKWADRLGVSQGLLAMVLVVAFLYAWAAEYLGGVAAITGSYVAGVLFAQTPYKTRINQGIHPLTYSMFVPVFFISIGLRANGRELGSQVELTLAIIAVAIVAKVLGCSLFARAAGFGLRPSVRVGVGMISRGEVGLIIAGYGLEHRIISSAVFSACVIMVLATTMVTPPLLRQVFPRKARRGRRIVEETIAGPPEETDGRR